MPVIVNEGLNGYKAGHGYNFGDLLKESMAGKYEIIAGALLRSTPPDSFHLQLINRLYVLLEKEIKQFPFRVLSYPVNICLPLGITDNWSNWSDETIRNVVRPDLSIVSNLHTIRTHCIQGAPEVIIEILSPQSRVKDTVTKFQLYMKTGVKHYWLIDPEEEWVKVFKLNNNGTYPLLPIIAHKGEQLKIDNFPGAILDLKELFEDNDSMSFS